MQYWDYKLTSLNHKAIATDISDPLNQPWFNKQIWVLFVLLWDFVQTLLEAAKTPSIISQTPRPGWSWGSSRSLNPLYFAFAKISILDISLPACRWMSLEFTVHFKCHWHVLSWYIAKTIGLHWIANYCTWYCRLSIILQSNTMLRQMAFSIQIRGLEECSGETIWCHW